MEEGEVHAEAEAQQLTPATWGPFSEEQKEMVRRTFRTKNGGGGDARDDEPVDVLASK